MKDDKRKKLEANTKNLLELLGEDPLREGLINTPKRVAKAWDFLTKGYTENLDELINNAIFEGESKDMVIVKNILFSIFLNSGLFLMLIIGIQNSTVKKKVNLIFENTVNLPISFIIGVSFISGSISGSITTNKFLYKKK